MYVMAQQVYAFAVLPSCRSCQTYWLSLIHCRTVFSPIPKRRERILSAFDIVPLLPYLLSKKTLIFTVAMENIENTGSLFLNRIPFLPKANNNRFTLSLIFFDVDIPPSVNDLRKFSRISRRKVRGETGLLLPCGICCKSGNQTVFPRLLLFFHFPLFCGICKAKLSPFSPGMDAAFGAGADKRLARTASNIAAYEPALNWERGAF